ncbi:MAG: SDR family oxidoreductase [Burkholderiaceae bacterium]|nr:SDR family oxidoreductase [Burkholderiaceae bacterium]
MMANPTTAHAAQLFDVTGRAYVVTGAASGIGLAIAEVLAANGGRLLLLDRDAQGLKDVASRLQASAASKAVDVADADAVRQAVDAFIADTGRIDGLFANAGISGGAGFGTAAGMTSGQLEHQDGKHWHGILDINLLGVLNSLQAVVPAMKRQRSGSIVITASITGIQAEPFVSYSYAAAKAAVIQVMRQSALELGPYGIRVNAIAPGFIKTAIAGGRLHDAAVEAALSRKIALGRLGAAHEVQGIALLLASSAGSYITGSVLPVDGGALLGPPPFIHTPSTDTAT